MKKPSRPALRWFGGKWLQAERIIGCFPPHRIYVEPFGGAASVLLRKPRSYAEIYNDLDDEVVNLFRVLRDPASAELLVRAIGLTPFARVEFDAAYDRCDEPVERARRLIIRSFQGFGTGGATSPWRTGFRAKANRSGTTPAMDWANYPPALAAISARFAGVIIEHRPASAVMAAHDGPDTLHYVDPPYPHETRQRTRRGAGAGGGGVYRHEMTDAGHSELLAFLRTLVGKVILSGYANPIYDEALGDWERLEYAALADGARPRREVLWINPAAQAGHGLFGHPACGQAPVDPEYENTARRRGSAGLATGGFE